MLYITPPIFFVIAFIFSMLGMGGSQLYIPILFWVGMDFKTEAIPLGMLLNVVNSSSAAITYARKGLINWKTAIPFGIAMILFAPLGTVLNINLPTKPVILIFALFTATAAILMLSGWRPKRTEFTPSMKVILGVIGGSVLGIFAGLIGRGGGSFVVPLLYIAGFEPMIAAATSALIVTFSGISSFISHLFTSANPNYLVWALCVVAVIIGSQLGSRIMASRPRSKIIRIVFGGVLLVVSSLLILKDIILE